MQQKARTTLAIVIIVVAVVLVGWRFLGQLPGGSETYRAFETSNTLLVLAHDGCEAYEKAKGSWPASLDALTKWETLPRKDAWGHKFVFVPYDPARGFGEIISFGRTGKPGGTGEDREFVIRFPTKANADWDQQQVMGVKLPPQMKSQSNWYQIYFK